jgi:asparagine synthase (glutamine-hydrolysing)
MTMSSGDAELVIPQLAQIYDEPFADSSQIPTYLVSKLAREKVTVSLSGDAGDELFGGYNRYTIGAKNWRTLSRIPLPIREATASVLRHTATTSVPPRISNLLEKAANALPSSSSRSMFRRITTTGTPELVLRDMKELPAEFENTWPIQANLAHQMMTADTLGYLPGDILVKVDRASMSHSLESRMPFLDHRVVEFAWSLPLEMKISKGDSKVVLRGVLEKHVPRALFERPKMGFGIPLAEWLRGPLRQWAEDLLTEKSLNSSGFFKVPEVRKQWADHLNHSRNHQYSLWNILMFQGWYQNSVSESSSCEHS